jgi:plasmid stabilization system protein ParE
LDKNTIAKKVVTEIYQKVQILQSFPKIGYEYENSQDKEIRILLYGHYRIAYLIKDENTIDILGVFHGALDIERYL